MLKKLANPLILEGTWEEVAAHASELAGRRVRLIILPAQAEDVANKPPAFRPAKGQSTAGSLLKHAGTWAGDDLKECLQDMYANRGKAKF